MKRNLNEQISRIKNMMGLNESIDKEDRKKLHDVSIDIEDDLPSDDLSSDDISEENEGDDDSHIIKRAYFNNGGSISVQASRYHYCEPRNDNGPYTELELGYPSRETKLSQSLIRHQEQSSVTDPYNNIFPYVPVKVLMKLADMNGGFVNGTKLPPMWIVRGKDENGKPIKDVWSGRVTE
jgi:hypothetical protein